MQWSHLGQGQLEKEGLLHRLCSRYDHRVAVLDCDYLAGRNLLHPAHPESRFLGIEGVLEDCGLVRNQVGATKFETCRAWTAFDEAIEEVAEKLVELVSLRMQKSELML